MAECAPSCSEMGTTSTEDQMHKECKPQIRRGSIRNIVRLLDIVAQTSVALTVATIACRVCRASLPFGLLWVMRLIVDNIISTVAHNAAQPGRIWIFLAVEMAIAVAQDVTVRIGTLCESLLADKFSNRLGVILMSTVSTLDLATLENPAFYDKLDRARKQSSERLALFTSVLDIGQDALTVALLGAALVAFSPWLLVLLVTAVIPSMLGEGRFTTLAYSLLYRWTPQKRALDYLRYLGASVYSAKEVKIFGLGPHLIRKYEQVSTDMYLANRALSVRRVLSASILHLLSIAGYYGAYFVILIRSLAGSLSIGTFTFLISSFYRSRSSIEHITACLNEIARQALQLDDLFELLDMRPTIRSRQNGLMVRSITRGFEFCDVSFRYPGSCRMAISNVSFRLRPGEKLALVGENGAGKSTIVKLIARLYDPTSGRILLDGVDLRDYSLENYHQQISAVFQDYVRYETVVRDNIGFGDLAQIDRDAELDAAAWKAGAQNFIEKLPKKYDQTVGRQFEDGIGLSGGEWQKLALSRAYMRNAQLLIFDEPTATLDPRAEFHAYQRFSELARDRMAILISHRFSTARTADRIIVLADGKIVEDGTHNHLISQGGCYAELFALQAAAYVC